MALALYTFGMFAKPAEDPANAGFYALNGPIFDLVDQAAGLIARSGYASDAGPESWGPEFYPKFYREKGDGWSPATLSLWSDLEALFSFTYFGLHATALKRGAEWFQKPSWPPLAMWWHRDETYPTWAEGVRRYEHLHVHGATPKAFDFKNPFDESGVPTRLDKARIQRLQAQNRP
jgi:hypothetical protein